jgi:epoxyqueuosine reductase QueG
MNDELQHQATEGGADFFGIADLEPVRTQLEHGWPLRFTGLRFGIAIGIRLNDWILDQLSVTPDSAIAKIYWHECYEVINARLDAMSARLAGVIQARGFAAVPAPATVKADAEGLLGLFSHKAVARLAGLGWIGRSCLLVTPQSGPRARWASVLTDAPLTPTGTPLEDACGDCQVCVDACPAQAFNGQAFRVDEPVERRFDVRACQAYQKQTLVCGLCLACCPYGMKTTIE